MHPDRLALSCGQGIAFVFLDSQTDRFLAPISKAPTLSDADTMLKPMPPEML
jgi:hypothetical protein